MVVVSSLGPPEEGIRHKEASTTTYINEKCLGKGTLYISEARISWVGDGGHTFSLEYPHVALHAVSKDVTAFPRAENLYLMIDVRLVDSEPPTPQSTPETSDDDDDADDDDEGMTEVRFVPDDKAKLDAMFNAMSQCQALHPDPAMPGDSEEEAEEAEEDEEEEEEEAEAEAEKDEGMYEDAEEGDGANGAELMDQ